MTNNTFLECERKELEKMKKYQLPYQYKKIGFWIAIISFISLFANKFTFDAEFYRQGARYGMLIGLLMVSISKEKVEDELVRSLRMQSYAYAFIAGVVLTLVQPFISYGIDLLFKSESATFEDVGDFQILWILLAIQVFYFRFLKKLYA